MTTTTQPLHVQRVIVTLIVVCVRFAFFAALGAAVWTLEFSVSDGSMQGGMSCVFLWIGLFVSCGSFHDFVTVFLVPPFRCSSRLFGVLVSPATYCCPAFLGVLRSPNPGLKFVPVAGRAELVSRIEWCEKYVTFAAFDFAHKLLSIAQKTSKVNEIIYGAVLPSSRRMKIQRQGDWPYGPTTEFSIGSTTTGKGPKDCSYSLNFVGRFTERWMRKLSLIDSKGEIPNEAEEVSVSSEFGGLIPHRERLNKRASLWDGAIVRTIREMNRMRLAEMTNPLQVVAA